ncbi:hypothetical protein [Dielma fastidiosa]|uniref:hypothetical protein n=1 Tax=Dielma fastidiosa TaxID=1034346 RepID=UPI003568BAD1
MERKTKFETLVSSAGKKAKNLLDNAVQVVDMNEDGKFDFTDVSVIAESMGSTVKKSTLIMKENAEERANLLELKALRPIFPESLDCADFIMPKFIRVIERDKKHTESDVCQGSIGYESDLKGLHIVNVFRDSYEAFGLIFYPDYDCEFYYVDPSERNKYIALDEYFSYLKIARVNELKKIAQDLGAKHFKVTYKEEQISFSEKKIKSHIKLTSAGNVGLDHDLSQKKYTTIDVVADMSFPGHAAIKPQLKYLQRDPSIQTLISMRMDENAPLLHEKFILKMSNSLGMKETDAVKIDAVLNALKCSGNATVASEAKNELRRYFEYDIEF